VKYLLDTTVISDFTRGVPPVIERLKRTAKADAAISVVTAMEIEYGLKLNPARARNIEPMIRALLSDLRELPFQREDAQAAAAVRAALTKRGTPIGPYDVMIGGAALRHGLTLVTSNSDEFQRIGGLIVEDWRAT
jgi:tRNA(fMet)-specific endonuclease VapC